MEPEATGDMTEDYGYKTISYPFDRYEIKVKVTSTNEFVGITEVKINKDFLSHRQRIGTLSYLDVDEYYRE